MTAASDAESLFQAYLEAEAAGRYQQAFDYLEQLELRHPDYRDVQRRRQQYLELGYRHGQSLLPPPAHVHLADPPVPQPPARRGWSTGTVVLVSCAGCLGLSAIVAVVLLYAVTTAVTSVSNRIANAVESGEAQTVAEGILGAVATATGGGAESNRAPGGPPRPTATPVEREMPTDPPRSLKYADLEITAKKGTISNRLPGELPRYRSDGATLELTLAAVNPTAESARIDAGQLQLKLQDGSIHRAPLNIGVQARDSVDTRIRFEVPLTATWTGAQLTIDQLGKEPGVLPLDGPVPAKQFPAKLAGGAEVSVPTPPVTYKLIDVAVDLDGAGTRAPVGTWFVIFGVLASNRDNRLDAFVGPGSFRLFVDGTPMTHQRLNPAAEAVGAGRSKEFRVTFTIPAATNSVELELGEADKGAKRIPVDLKTAKP
ncbi:MAG: hypothetical protein HY329_23690 [Chloroflexi bacterium]|nr:hypothetical protein [Chloroflexota bacterium]